MPDIQLDNRRDGRDRRHGIERQTVARHMAFKANGRRMRRGFLNTIPFGFACGPFLDYNTYPYEVRRRARPRKRRRLADRSPDLRRETRECPHRRVRGRKARGNCILSPHPNRLPWSLLPVSPARAGRMRFVAQGDVSHFVGCRHFKTARSSSSFIKRSRSSSKI